MSDSVHDWVSYHAGRRPDAPAVTSVERGRTATWGEMEARVARLAHVLRHDMGLERGDRVATIAENDIRTFELQFACMRAGLILVPLNWRLAVGELVTLMHDAEPSIIVYDDTWSTTAEAVAEAADIQLRLSWGDASDVSEYEALMDAGDAGMPGGVHDEAEITHILYTSGTTGLPKGAMCSHCSLKQHAINLAHASRLAERGNNHLNVVPLFHAGGLNTYTNATLFWGGQVTTVRRFDPAVALKLLTDPKVGITHMCGVLQMYEMITALPQFAGAMFPALKTALFGGWGPQTKWVHETWRARGFFLQLSYGSTECGPIVSVLEAGDELASKNCSGSVVAGTQVRLVDREGADVAQGEVGEIWAKGGAITPGYWRRPREDYFSGDWFKTGDCARADEAGRLYIVDRLREVYRSGGENVYPAEVELVLAQAPGVKEIAVIAVPDQKWGEVGLAVVQSHEGASVTLESLLAHAADKLARYKQPKYLVTIEEMPRNATLKIDRTALKNAHGGVAAVAAPAN
ncbi:class I adenylate-forming enzyme family protein [Terricaulis silvestris]|uniref:Long-chain-fatty-acid--CoA ligase FadD13 n=1 Tax=Terricaulis silvestris TaxID=2686094 RepID=A0A6I6MQE6_9CAUL|nr:AMP-binding protein [Terricaulis silvestris]QGZ93772.1 Long-chain-fatty-acid--CoA ligase FadD13 [Terricaulis silvestris]